MIRVLLCLALTTAQDDFDLSGSTGSGKIAHKLFHSYDGVNWEVRGTIQLSIFGDKRRKPLISVKNTKFEKEKLNFKGNYYVGVYIEGESGFMVQSSAEACYLIGSDLQDIISVLVDSESGVITALNYKTEGKMCERTTTAQKIQTMAEVLSTREALKPYFALPKPEIEQENVSFLRKYVRFT